LFTWLSFGSAQPSKVAQFSVGVNTEIANSIKKAEKRLQRTQQDLAEAQAQLDTKKAANAALGAFQRKPKPDASTETDPEQDLDSLF
jgi:hypothetical protein